MPDSATPETAAHQAPPSLGFSRQEHWSGLSISIYNFLHSSVDGHLGFFHILAIVNNAAMNSGVHVCFQLAVFVFFGYMSRIGIAGS